MEKLNTHLKQINQRQKGEKKQPIKFRDKMKQFLHEKHHLFETGAGKSMSKEEINFLLSDLRLPAETRYQIDHVKQNIMLTNRISKVTSVNLIHRSLKQKEGNQSA